MNKGDYVLATKYVDGDPQDHWCVGWYQGKTNHSTPRFDVVDDNGKLFRGNGFRRVEKITAVQGKYLIEDNKDRIEKSGKSLWWWLKTELQDPKQPELCEGCLLQDGSENTDVFYCPICKVAVCSDHSETFVDRDVEICLGCVNEWLSSMGVK